MIPEFQIWENETVLMLSQITWKWHSFEIMCLGLKNFKALPLNLRLPSKMYEGHMDITKWLLRTCFKNQQHEFYE